MAPIFRDLPDVDLPEAMQRGRSDPPWFCHYFLRRKLHDGQAHFITDAQATINVLATSNRWGKTALLACRHFWKCFYKEGAEPKYVVETEASAKTRALELDCFGEYRTPPDTELDFELYLRAKYYTVHTAGLWDTASLVWQDALKIIQESKRLQPFIKDTPRTLPPRIVFANGSHWLFRTLGDNGEGIDGHSFYLVTIDEAGWIKNLEGIVENVARVRVADVQGMLDLVGTMKVGISRDFYRYAHRASVETGAKVAFDHRDGRNYEGEFAAAIERAESRAG